MYIPGDIYYKQFVTNNISGVSANADALPKGVLNRNGLDDFSTSAQVFVSNIDIGRYNVSGVIPATYRGGDSVNVTVSGTISTNLTKAVFDLGVLDRAVSVSGGTVNNVINSVSVSAPAPANFLGIGSIVPGVTVSVTGNVPSVTTVTNAIVLPATAPNNFIAPASMQPGVTVSVTGVVSNVTTVATVTNAITLPATAPNNFIAPASVQPGVTVSVTGNIPTSISGPVSVSGGTINHVIDPVSVTGLNMFTATDISQLRYKIGIDGTATAPVGQFAGKLELSSSGVRNVVVENGIDMNQWMSLIGAVLAGSSTVTNNVISYYAVNNNGTLRLQSTAVSGARQAITIYLPNA